MAWPASRPRSSGPQILEARADVRRSEAAVPGAPEERSSQGPIRDEGSEAGVRRDRKAPANQPLHVAAENGRAPRSVERDPYVGADAVQVAATLNSVVGSGPKTIMVTGVMPRHGVSTVAADVGIALALMDQGPILLLDANLRSPSLHQVFGVQQEPGLADAMVDRVGVDDIIVETGVAGLSLMPSGRREARSPVLLLSERCDSVLRGVRDRFRLTIVDAPPMLQFPESAPLASRVDGVVLVMASGRCQRADVVEMKRLLDGLGVNVLGMVLTETVRRGLSSNWAYWRR